MAVLILRIGVAVAAWHGSSRHDHPLAAAGAHSAAVLGQQNFVAANHLEAVLGEKEVNFVGVLAIFGA